MSIFRQFKTDEAKEINGVPVEFGANDDGSVPTFYVARASRTNKAYTKELERVSRPHRRQLELGTLNDEKSEAIYLDVFVSVLLKGWSNVQDEQGKDVPFTEENARMVLTTLPDLYGELQRVANTSAMFKDEQTEREAGN